MIFNSCGIYVMAYMCTALWLEAEAWRCTALRLETQTSLISLLVCPITDLGILNDSE